MNVLKPTSDRKDRTIKNSYRNRITARLTIHNYWTKRNQAAGFNKEDSSNEAMKAIRAIKTIKQLWKAYEYVTSDQAACELDMEAYHRAEFEIGA